MWRSLPSLCAMTVTHSQCSCRLTELPDSSFYASWSIMKIQPRIMTHLRKSTSNRNEYEGNKDYKEQKRSLILKTRTVIKKQSEHGKAFFF